MRLNPVVDVSDVMRGLDLADEAIRFATMTAINRTLAKVLKAERAELQGFDRPTPYTMNSLFVDQAKPERLWGRVWVKDDAGKGTPATKYLLPNVEGGDRGMKRFERALYLAGILPNGMYAVPGKGARLDAYGNMSRGQIVQILSWFAAFGEQGYRSNMTDKGRLRLAQGTAKRPVRGIEYFVVRSQSGGLKTPGVYQKRRFGFGDEIRPVLIFVDGAPNYERRFDWYGVGQRIVREEFGPEMRRSLAAQVRRALKPKT
jgi:hypothetical protein